MLEKDNSKMLVQHSP